MKDNTAAVHVQVPVEVTSFLLNEKRTEISKIELKQRVTVLLVPNKNLETPNYRLERLRQDDPRLENLQVSYKMVDEPEEEVGFTRRERSKAKQEPVIKGLLPETPAPVATPKPAPVEAAAKSLPTPVAAPAAPGSTHEGGLFNWMKRLFARDVVSPDVAATAKSPVTAAALPAAPRSDRGERGARGGRGGRGGGRGERGERGDRSERPERDKTERNGAVAEVREDRSKRGDRSERPDRGSRGDRPERSAPDQGAAPLALVGGGAEERAQRSEGPPPGEGRGEPRPGRGGRGSHGNQDPRRSRPVQETRAEPDVAVASPAAAAVVAGSDPGQAQGEGQPARRRGRRGGRGGRDRDDSHEVEIRTVQGDQDQPAAVAKAGELADHQGMAAELPLRAAGNGLSERHDESRADAAPTQPGDDRPERGQRRPGRDRQRSEHGEQAVADGAALDADGQAGAAPSSAQFEAGGGDTPMTDVTPREGRRPEAMAASSAEPLQRPAAVPSVPFVLPLETLQGVAAASGLEWVSSDPEKTRAVQEAMAREAVPAHVPRQRPSLARIDDGPLVLVETRKDLSQTRLPFETGELR